MISVKEERLRRPANRYSENSSSHGENESAKQMKKFCFYSVIKYNNRESKELQYDTAQKKYETSHLNETKKA